MSTLTDTKIINLLERLSVIAPERCEVRYSDYFGTSGTYPIYFVSFAGERVRIADGPGDHHPLNWSNPAALLYAVLEEAHVQGWYSDGCYSWWALYNGKIASAQVDVQIEGQLAFVVVDPNATSLLELEILPRLECLVLALETKGRAM